MKRASGSALKASSTSSGFYHVHLDGALQPNDRLAMRELASQLVSQGAFGAGEVEVEDADPVENQERAEEQLEVDDDDDDEHANALNDDDEEYDGIDTAAIFVSDFWTCTLILS